MTTRLRFQPRRDAVRVAASVLLLALARTPFAAGTLPTYGPSQVLFNPNRPPVFSATADFNCDNRMDAVVANGDGSSTTYPVTILLADGSGSFVDGTSQVVVGATHQTQYPSGIVLADFNGDGRADVFIPDQANQSDGSVGYQNTLLLSTPDCRLTDGTAGIPQQQDYTTGAAAADVDGDGDLDLLVDNDWGPNPPVPMQLWLNNGSGGFSIAQGALPAALTAVNQIGIIGYRSSAFVDVNGDGFVDLVLGSDQRAASNPLVLLNDGTGRFTQLANAMPARPFGAGDIAMDVKSADFNHDGKPDLVLAYRIHSFPRGRWLQILINNGDGTFRDETAVRLPQTDNTDTWYNAVYVVDIDGDGNLDLVGKLAFGVGGQLFAVGDASGVFTPVSLQPGGGLDAAFTFVDVNANGHRDLVSIDTTRVTLFPNTGPVLPPGIPQQVRARGLSDRVRLTWPYVWGATSYQVWRSASAATPGSQIGTSTPTMFDDLTAGASPAYYTVRAVNGAGTSAAGAAVAGSIASAPAVVTVPATNIGTSTATLNATVTPLGSSTTAVFQYGQTTSYGSQVTASPAPGSGTSPVAVSAAVTGLFCGSSYHFRAVAVNAGGTTNGADVALTAAACPPPTSAPLPYGVMEDLAWDNPGDVDFLIDKMVAAGVQTVRMPFRWYMIEPTNNQFTFAYHDPIVSKLRAKGIEILGLLQHPPDWALGGNPPGTSPPLNDADWQDYVTQVAVHYRGQVASWEVWNEENLRVFFTPQPNAVRYTQMLKVAFDAIRSADPTAAVVLGGLGGNGVNTGNETPEEQYFLQKIYDNGGRNYFDVLAIHPYAHPITRGLSALQSYVQDTHAVMAANGDAAKPLWLTEIGWTIDPAYLPPINETDQANWLTTVYHARAGLGVDRIYWYELHELYPPPTDVGWGLIRHNLTLRPSYFAYQSLTSSPPAVTVQPQSQLIAVNASATVSVTATGAEPLTYAWYAGASGTTTTPVAGAIASSYTTPPLAGPASYWVRVGNAFGSVDSAAATIAIGFAPSIATQPQSQTIASGQSATLNVVAAGSPPLAYQWHSGPSGNTANPIGGATSSSFTTPALAASTGYWVRVSNTLGQADSTTATIAVAAPPVLALSLARLNFGVITNGTGGVAAQTPAQTLTLTQAGTGTVNWTVTTPSWLSVDKPSGTGPATVTVSINPSGLPAAGTLTGVFTINASAGGGANNPSIPVALTVKALAGGAPSGAFDTPTDGAAGLAGSIAVTGWATDDVGVARIRVMRAPVAGEGSAPVFLGDAVQVAGARPDIEVLYPTSPMNERAGWGYLLLTNFLPGQGNGPYTLYAYADDYDGHSTLLGVKQIACSNRTSTAPFGAIDTPAQGGAAGGAAYINFGWALAGQPTGRFIPFDGSTITVFIDSLPAGTLTSYNNPRADIQALFPGYANTDGAVGLRPLDTTALANGVHTISWLVVDNLGAAAGIGSRFFTVSNSSVTSGVEPAGDARHAVDAPATIGSESPVPALLVDSGAVALRRGYDPDALPEWLMPDDQGVRHVRTAQLERIVLELGAVPGESASYRGYTLVGDERRALPIGSHLDARTGEFAWTPPLAFGGRHELLFVKTTAGGDWQIRVRVDVDAQSPPKDDRGSSGGR